MPNSSPPKKSWRVDGSETLDDLAVRIKEGHVRAVKGGAEWVEGSLEVAAALYEARERHHADINFSQWLRKNNLIYKPHDRTALIDLGSDSVLARTILTETNSRSYELIWRQNKQRFANARKPARRKRSSTPRHSGTCHRAMKLGEETLAKLKGTSLDRADELDELVVLNRGAELGKLTPTVQKLVDEAASGEIVSALTVAGRHKAPSLIEAWKKRMVHAWTAASDDEQNELMEFLKNLRRAKSPRTRFFGPGQSAGVSTEAEHPLLGFQGVS